MFLYLLSDISVSLPQVLQQPLQNPFGAICRVLLYYFTYRKFIITLQPVCLQISCWHPSPNYLPRLPDSYVQSYRENARPGLSNNGMRGKKDSLLLLRIHSKSNYDEVEQNPRRLNLKIVWRSPTSHKTIQIWKPCLPFPAPVRALFPPRDAFLPDSFFARPAAGYLLAPFK